jgi:phosphatidylserine/phosphatidylglycerophosphate/cardiolipin synthase-like enzyme
MNVLDYENEADGFNFLNRDTDILIRGPAATSLLGSFVRLWKRYDKEGRSIAAAESLVAHRVANERSSGVRGREHYARWFADRGTRMRGICRTAVQGDNAEPQNIASILKRYVEATEQSFYMTSPELDFALDAEEPDRLDTLAGLMMEKARNQQMYVVFITNGADGGMGESSIFLSSRVKDSQLVGEPMWEDMLNPALGQLGNKTSRRIRVKIQPLVHAGVHAFQYVNYVHAKQFYFDRLCVGISSWNFDRYSANNNHECAVFCLDKSLRLQLERQLVLDMINSVPIVLPR